MSEHSAAGQSRRTGEGPRGRRSLASEVSHCLRIALIGGTKVLLLALVPIAILVASTLLLFKWVDPPGSMLMLGQRLQGNAIDHHWVALDDISPQLIRAVIMSEDGRFCTHRGIDLAELEAALAKAQGQGDEIVRGASTITMQVAKNLFLWPSRSYLRKGLEMALALAIERAWDKRRILEVYLNIAEWGPGVFGAEAGALYHFGKPAAGLTGREASLMAVALPNPIERNPARPGAGVRRLASIVESRMRVIGRRSACIESAGRTRTGHAAGDRP